ncbi:M3 family metallopeptidase, partial [Streptococcus pyogenes]
RWIDFSQNEGKATGGYCATLYDGPSYILLSWTGLMNEVLVLAHELGHAGHFQLAKKQSILNYEPSLYFIEAPSTANEVLT